MKKQKVKFIDLFCGIGGFRYAIQGAALKSGIDTECVFSSDIDPHCQQSYFANFGESPHGDITKVDEKDVPDHDLLLAGFPCQSFSIIGAMRGFEDTRGTLFFDIARIISEKKPKYFVLENVKQLMGHDKGKTLNVIIETLKSLGYSVKFKVLNALDFGLPQKRERIWIVGSLEGLEYFNFPSGHSTYKSLDEILEKDIPESYYASNYIKEKRKTLTQHKKISNETTIWHENKSGNISAYPYSCALRAGASYNYLLVNGERRLLPRVMLRLQGFPESFKISVSDGQIRKQAGNSLPVNVAESVIYSLLQQGIVNVKSKIKNSRKIQTTLPDQSISIQSGVGAC